MKRAEFLRQMEERLRKRRQELLATLAGEVGQLRLTEDRLVGDTADLAVEEDYGQINANLAGLISDEVRQIDAALERLANGTYGICEDCGRAIPMARLTVLPFATQCVRCKEQAERHEQPTEPLAHWDRLADESGEDGEESENQIDWQALAQELAA